MKFIEFINTLGQRTLINRDWIVFVRDVKENYTIIYVGAQGKNVGPQPINVVGDYDTIIKMILSD